jgi:hypothetical protein
MFYHPVPPTDFLVVVPHKNEVLKERKKSHNNSFNFPDFFIREINGYITVGQEEPEHELPKPNSSAQVYFYFFLIFFLRINFYKIVFEFLLIVVFSTKNLQ